MYKTFLAVVSLLSFATSAFAEDCVKVTNNTPDYAGNIVIGETTGCVTTHEVHALYDGNYVILKENTSEVANYGAIPDFAGNIIISEK